MLMIHALAIAAPGLLLILPEMSPWRIEILHLERGGGSACGVVPRRIFYVHHSHLLHWTQRVGVNHLCHAGHERHCCRSGKLDVSANGEA